MDVGEYPNTQGYINDTKEEVTQYCCTAEVKVGKLQQAEFVGHETENQRWVLEQKQQNL